MTNYEKKATAALIEMVSNMLVENGAEELAQKFVDESTAFVKQNFNIDISATKTEGK